jgi:transcriptional regulator with XRE-family HTH domain
MPVELEAPSAARINGLGAAIKRHRQACHLTQAQLAAQAGIHVTYVSHLEAGRSHPGWEVLCALSAALEIRLSDLIRKAEDR